MQHGKSDITTSAAQLIGRVLLSGLFNEQKGTASLVCNMEIDLIARGIQNR